MKLKILSLVGLLSVIFIAAVIWRMNHFIHEDRTSWAQAQMRTQILSLQQTTQSVITDLQHRTSILQEPSRNKSFWTSMDPFKAIAWVRDLNNPTLENASIKEGAGLDDTNLASAVKDLQGKVVAQGKFLLMPWKDSQNRNWLMVVWPWSENRKLVLWTGAEYLQALLETYKGSLAQLSFVSDSGQVLAHSHSEYFATRVNDSYLFKDFKASGAGQGGGSFQDNSGEDFQGYYEAIPNTNLVLTASASYHDLLADKNKVWASFLLIGLGLVLLTLGGISLLKFSEDAVATPMPPLPPASPAKVGMSPENRQEAFKKIAASLGHEMRSPLARILGFAQMLSEKQKDDATASGYINSILRETRFARILIDKLFSFAQEKESVMSAVRAESAVRNLIQRSQSDLQKKNIQLIQKISDTNELLADAALLEKALDAVLQNAVESLERKTKKEIHITVQKASLGGTEIIIQDTGEGIASENIARVFDPFYTTRSFTNHLGLGLSAAYGVIKQHGGDIKVESEKGQGTTVTFVLPEKNISKEPSPSSVTPPLSKSLSSAEPFSPADVEIEQLLELQDSEVGPAHVEATPVVVTKSVEVQEIIIDDDRTVNLSLAPGIVDKAPFMSHKAPSVLDEYKVKIRRPRGPVLENS